MHRLLITTVATSLVVSDLAAAQDPHPVPANLLRFPLRAEQPVRLQVGSTFLQGRYVYAKPDSITLSIRGSLRSVHARDVQGIWVQRNRALPAAIIVGTVTGLLGGLAFSGFPEGDCDSNQCESRILPFLQGASIVGGIGAGVGAAIGSAFTRWVPLR